MEIFESGVVVQKIKDNLLPSDEFIIRRYKDGSVYYQINELDPIKSGNSLLLLKDFFAYGVGYQAGDIIIEATIEPITEVLYLDEPVEFKQEFSGSISTSGHVDFLQEFTGSVAGSLATFRQEFTGSV
ncbi:MAG: hypothetical protein D3910_24930, partial [Candidatus Electrothrix sp. ATG2]|nr:hypothetical protein [Candidatus Electrothrix sp. ATG2]